MVNVVVVWVFHPDPEWLTASAMHFVIPLELRMNAQSHPEHRAGDGLDAGLQGYLRNLSDTLLHCVAHTNVVNQMSCKDSALCIIHVRPKKKIVRFSFPGGSFFRSKIFVHLI